MNINDDNTDNNTVMTDDGEDNILGPKILSFYHRFKSLLKTILTLLINRRPRGHCQNNNYVTLL